MKKTIPYNAVLIPDVAQRVFHGKLFDVFQWNQVLYDGSNTIFEMVRRPDTVVIIGIDDESDRLILVKDRQPNKEAAIQFPAGRVEENDESWLGAARREMQEETGYTFRNWKLVNVVQPENKIEWFVAWYIAYDIEAKRQPNVDSGEDISVHLEEFSLVRQHILDGSERLGYARHIFKDVQSVDSLRQLCDYSGRITER